MRFLKVPKLDAEVTKSFLLSHSLIDHGHAIEKDEDCIYFPLQEGRNPELEYETVERAGQERTIQQDLRAALREQLNPKELEHLKTAYDVVGDIAIIEVDKALEQKAKLIAETLLNLFSNIKVVLQRGKHEGEFRTQKLKHLAGEDRKETTHKENGVQLQLNVEQVYFSARLATERKRIAELVERDERVLVMFSGCAPYPCVIAKLAKPSEVVGIELNPSGHAYGEENVKLNNLSNVRLINGDVRDETEKLEGLFDRVLMPLPKEAERFLDVALSKVVQGGIIHLYQFWNEKDLQKNTKQVLQHIQQLGYHADPEDITLCGQHAPGVFRICLDLRIT
jgi:tRNA (guanine37-N1)-methyltransferase